MRKRVCECFPPCCPRPCDPPVPAPVPPLKTRCFLFRCPSWVCVVCVRSALLKTRKYKGKRHKRRNRKFVFNFNADQSVCEGVGVCVGELWRLKRTRSLVKVLKKTTCVGKKQTQTKRAVAMRKTPNCRERKQPIRSIQTDPIWSDLLGSDPRRSEVNAFVWSVVCVGENRQFITLHVWAPCSPLPLRSRRFASPKLFFAQTFHPGAVFMNQTNSLIKV